MKECYECGKKSAELSPRSRCVTCEYNRAKFNEVMAEDMQNNFFQALDLVKALRYTCTNHIKIRASCFLRLHGWDQSNYEGKVE